LALGSQINGLTSPENRQKVNLRELFHRKTMAGERHRANVARLRMSDTWKLRCLKIVPG
jgi:hypothetical protein